jgi:hypothetical protein
MDSTSKKETRLLGCSQWQEEVSFHSAGKHGKSARRFGQVAKGYCISRLLLNDVTLLISLSLFTQPLDRFHPSTPTPLRNSCKGLMAKELTIKKNLELSKGNSKELAR